MRDITALLVHGTPIETHDVAGHTVYVKRDDLCTNDPRLPCISKLRGLIPYLLECQRVGISHVAVYDTRISRTGLATAILCWELGIDCTIYCPQFEDSQDPMPQHALAADYNATLYYLIVQDKSIPHYYDAIPLAKARGRHLLPYGLNCREAVLAHQEEARRVPFELSNGTVVLCIGSGTTAQGIKIGLTATAQLVGVTVGTEPTLTAFDLYPSEYSYYEPAQIKPPFPCDPYYDAKAWEFLVYNIGQLEPPVLFWNMG